MPKNLEKGNIPVTTIWVLKHFLEWICNVIVAWYDVIHVSNEQELRF